MLTKEESKFLNVIYAVLNHYEEVDLSICMPMWGIKAPDRIIPFGVKVASSKNGNEGFMLDVLGHVLGDDVDWKFSGDSVLVLMTEKTKGSLKHLMELDEEGIKLWLELQPRM